MASLAPVHSVQFYDDHEALIGRLCGVVSSALLVGNSVLIVCTAEHQVQLMRALERLEINVRDHARRGCFSVFDTSEMLASFMRNGFPDAKLFRASLGSLLIEARKSARSKNHGLTVFGEMVAVLWAEGNKAGALALEALWNDLMSERAFHLHCAYPSWLFGKDRDELNDICEVHSHILGLAAA